MKLRLVAIVACMAVGLAACGTGEEPALENKGGEGPKLAMRATPGKSSIEVEAYVLNFNIVNKMGQPPKSGEGHIHFYIDVAKIPTTPGKPAVTNDASTYHAAASTTFTWRNVKPGEHILGVQLVNNDHTPLEPPVTNQVKATVK